MAEEQETVTGKIAQVKPWKNSKGYFLNIEGNSNDFYGFGKPHVEEGEEVTFVVKEGTGSFADKIAIVRKMKPDEEPPKPKEKPKTDTDKVLDGIEDAKTVYMDKQNLIVRQCCIKAGAQMVGELMPRAEHANWTHVAAIACDIADTLYEWVTMQEPPLPEPPEEPEEPEGAK